MTAMLRLDLAELAPPDRHRIELIGSVLGLEARRSGDWLDLFVPPDGSPLTDQPVAPSWALLDALEGLVASLRAGEHERAAEVASLGRLWAQP